MRKLFKIAALLSALIFVISCSACSLESKRELSESDISQNSSEMNKPLNKSPLGPKGKEDKHIVPDKDKVDVPDASKKISDTSSEEKFVEALEKFANPNGNKYDAISVLGRFRYDEDEESLYARLDTDCKTWHEGITAEIGENCIVDIKLDSKTDVPPDDMRFTDWNQANGITADAYSNIKCVVTSNYSSGSVTWSLDIIKTEGNWYLANMGSINKLRTIITKDLYV